jgi:hypothetical protein
VKSVKGEKPTVKTGQASLVPREGASNIGPGPCCPKGAPPPASKGSISYPKQVGR